MKNNYKRKKLCEVCEIISGTTPKTNIKEYWNGDFNWITPAEISEKEDSLAFSFLRWYEREFIDSTFVAVALFLLIIGLAIYQKITE